MLYGKKPDLGNLKEWGSKVWVHTADGTKLDGQSKVGKWMGFDGESNGHRIFWPDKHSISVERNVKFANGDMILPPIPSAEPIQGENNGKNKTKNPMNLRHTLATESESNQPEETEHTLDPDQPLDQPDQNFEQENAEKSPN
jgi:hypothetical protein